MAGTAAAGPDPGCPGPGEAGGPAPGATPPEPGSDWAGLPEELLVKVAATLVAQTDAGWAAHLKKRGWTVAQIQEEMARRKY